jgi:hypothetical protein
MTFVVGGVGAGAPVMARRVPLRMLTFFVHRQAASRRDDQTTFFTAAMMNDE